MEPAQVGRKSGVAARPRQADRNGLVHLAGRDRARARLVEDDVAGNSRVDDEREAAVEVADALQAQPIVREILLDAMALVLKSPLGSVELAELLLLAEQLRAMVVVAKSFTSRLSPFICIV